MTHAVVVGAGVGGLAAAAALAAEGWDVTVVERSDHARPAGSALALWSNAFRALEVIAPEVAEELRSRTFMHGQAGLRTPNGEYLTRVDVGSMHERTGGPPILVRRQELHGKLAGRVPETAFRLGCTAAVDLADPLTVSLRVEPSDVSGRSGTSGRSDVELSGVEQLRPDLVVAADGVGSSLRALVDPAPAVVSAGYTSWRGMVSPGAVDIDDGGETWGQGQRFGYVGLSDGGAYWYATLDNDERLWPHGHAAQELDHLQHVFADWHPPIATLIQGTPVGAVSRQEARHLWPQPRSFVHGRLVLLGDAAHAMTPDLGQGACQALCDAVELSAAVRPALQGTTDVPTALRSYDRRSRRRTTKLAKQARSMARISQLSKPLAASTRNALVRLLPGALVAKAVASTVSWRPPD